MAHNVTAETKNVLFWRIFCIEIIINEKAYVTVLVFLFCAIFCFYLWNKNKHGVRYLLHCLI